jgi:hypothetical protein
MHQPVEQLVALRSISRRGGEPRCTDRKQSLMALFTLGHTCVGRLDQLERCGVSDDKNLHVVTCVCE